MSTTTVPARPTDPQTSWDAAHTIDRPASHEAVLTVLKITGPATDFQMLDQAWVMFELGYIDRFSESRLRTARHELEKLGLVEWVDRQGVSPSGRLAQRWQVIA